MEIVELHPRQFLALHLPAPDGAWRRGVTDAPRLGIVAGGGALPARLIAACKSTRRDVFVLALEGQADASLVDGVPHRWNRLGAVGAGLARLKEAAVAEIVLAGHVKKPGLVALRPDAKALSVLARLAGGLAAGDNAMLAAVVRMLEDEGFRVVAAEDVLRRAARPRRRVRRARARRCGPR